MCIFVYLRLCLSSYQTPRIPVVRAPSSVLRSVKFAGRLLSSLWRRRRFPFGIEPRTGGRANFSLSNIVLLLLSYNVSVHRYTQAIFSNIVLGALPLGLYWKILLSCSRCTLYQCSAVQCSAVQCSAALRSSVSVRLNQTLFIPTFRRRHSRRAVWCAVQCGVQCSVVCRAVQCSAVWCVVQCSVVFCAVQ
jgi:hypothetical protein